MHATIRSDHLEQLYRVYDICYALDKECMLHADGWQSLDVTDYVGCPACTGLQAHFAHVCPQLLNFSNELSVLSLQTSHISLLSCLALRQLSQLCLECSILLLDLSDSRRAEESAGFRALQASL